MGLDVHRMENRAEVVFSPLSNMLQVQIAESQSLNALLGLYELECQGHAVQVVIFWKQGGEHQVDLEASSLFPNFIHMDFLVSDLTRATIKGRQQRDIPFRLLGEGNQGEERIFSTAPGQYITFCTRGVVGIHPGVLDEGVSFRFGHQFMTVGAMTASASTTFVPLSQREGREHGVTGLGVGIRSLASFAGFGM